MNNTDAANRILELDKTLEHGELISELCDKCERLAEYAPQLAKAYLELEARYEACKKLERERWELGSKP